jgi:hypothetical protein
MAQADPARSLVHVGVRVDPAIADRLRASERGLSDEIRERLERSFKYDEVDPVTRELAEGLINIAALVAPRFLGRVACPAGSIQGVCSSGRATAFSLRTASGDAG